MIDRERMISLLNLVSELMQEYQDKYDALKCELPSELKGGFWCKGWREAYAPDYVNEISDNTQESRKILPKEPRKKAYTSLHNYCENKPVVSLFYGNAEKPVIEKFFVETDTMIVGIGYTTSDGSIYSLSIETRNADGLPCEYTVCYRDMNDKYYDRPGYLLRSAAYEYDAQRHIVFASYIDRLKVNTGAEDSLTDAAPECMEDYRFIYENGTVTHFTRINYAGNFEKVSENTWKFDRWILKRYQDDGIRYFG